MATIDEIDPWNPNHWDLTLPERRIYADDNAQIFAVVDEDDYWFFTRWKWNYKRSRCHSSKLYLKRAGGIYDNGIRIKTPSYYLHIEIMKRTGIPRPTPAHLLVDHRNGDSLYCRKANLRWATFSMNAKNLNGKNGHDLVEG